MTDPLAALLDDALRPYLELLRSPDDQNGKIIRGVAARLRAAGVTTSAPADPRCVECGQPDRGHSDSHGFNPHTLAAPAEGPCGVMVAMYEVAYGDLYDPCTKLKGHTGHHDPSWRHVTVDHTGDATGYIQLAAPAEGLEDVPCYDQHEAGIDEHWHAIPARSGFSCIVCGERLLEERQFCAKCEPTWKHAAPAEGLREAVQDAIDNHLGRVASSEPFNADQYRQHGIAALQILRAALDADR